MWLLLGIGGNCKTHTWHWLSTWQSRENASTLQKNLFTLVTYGLSLYMRLLAQFAQSNINFGWFKHSAAFHVHASRAWTIFWQIGWLRRTGCSNRGTETWAWSGTISTTSLQRFISGVPTFRRNRGHDNAPYYRQSFFFVVGESFGLNWRSPSGFAGFRLQSCGRTVSNGSRGIEHSSVSLKMDRTNEQIRKNHVGGLALNNGIPKCFASSGIFVCSCLFFQFS